MLERLRAGKSSVNGIEKPKDVEAKEERSVQVAEVGETEEERAARFQRKLVKYFSVREKDIDLDPQQTDADPAEWTKQIQKIVHDRQGEALASRDAEVDEHMRQRVLDDLAIDKISDKDMEACLLRIRCPFAPEKGGLRKIFAEVDQSPMQKQILAVASGEGLTDWDKVDESTMRSLLSGSARGKLDFRTPVGYEVFKRRFLREIDKRATDEQKQAYTEAANKLEETMYGRRLEYYRQFQALKREADERFGRKVDAHTAQVVANTADRDLGGANGSFVALRENLSEQDYAAKRDSLLGRAVIDGSPWDVNGREYRLNVQHLERAGLAPEYETKIDEQEVYLSKIFQLNSGSPAVISYIPTDEGEVTVNSYHRELSTGLWKMLPDYVRRPNSLQISEFGYGYGENSLVLPVQLQQTLAQLETKFGAQRMAERNTDFLFAGMTRGYASLQEYSDRLAARQMRGNYYEEVASEPSNHDFQMISAEKKPPYTQSINVKTAPNFDEVVAKYSTTTVFVGPTFVKCYKSSSGDYLYAFDRDSRGRAWISQIENLRSPVTSTGLRRDWVDGGALLTPLYEPSREAGEWGDPKDVRGANVCMWNGYLKNVPLIEDFVKHNKK